MTANVDAMVKEGIRAFKADKKDEARALFEKATELDSYNEQAWLWLSAVVDTEEDQRVCLENVLFINPENPAALKGLSKLKSGNDDVIATSSASSTFMPEEPAPEVYDEWMDNLNIGGSSSSDAPAVDPFSADIDDNLFEDAFKGEFDPFEEEPVSFDDAFGNDPFATNTDDEDDSYVDDDDSYVDDDEEDEYGSYDSYDDMYEDDSGSASAFAIDDDPFADMDDIGGGPFGTSDYDDGTDYAAEPTGSPRSPVASPVSESSVKSPTSSTAVDDDDQDPSVFFAKIPKSIRATRVPGKNERYPLVALLALFILIIANIGAIGFYVLQVMG